MKLLLLLCTANLIILGSGCSQSKNETANMPPSFLDPAPSRPTSDTAIWAGVNLLTDPPINDYLLVIEKGRVLGWGQRGTVDVPNDSMGVDMRAYWISPKAGAQFQYSSAGKIQLTDFLVLRGSKLGKTPSLDEATIVGEVTNSTLDFFQPEES